MLEDKEILKGLTEELGDFLEDITHIPGIGNYQKVIAGAVGKLEKEEALSTEELQGLVETLNALSVKIMGSDWNPALEANLLARGLARWLKEKA